LSTSLPEMADENRSHGPPQPDDRVAISELLRFKERLAVSRWLLLELMYFKRALVEKLGVERGFLAYLRALRDPRAAGIPGGARLVDCDVLERQPIKSLRQFAVARAEAFIELAPAGEPFAVPPPKLIGEGNHRTLHAATRSIFLTCLSNARIRSRSAFVRMDDAALVEYQDTELTRIDEQLDFDPWIFHASNNEAWLTMPKGNAASIKVDAAFALIGPHSHDFGHWLWEYLPKYIAAKLSGLLPPVPILIDATMPGTHREALQCMLPEGVEIIALPPYGTADVARLWCASGQMYMPVQAVQNERSRWEYLCTPPDRFSTIVREMARCSVSGPASTAGAERLFLARKPYRHCKLVNHEAIETAAAARGFKVVYSEDFSFREQASMLRQARFVVAPYGSAILLEFFARQGSKLCMLSHPYTFEAQIWAEILAGIGVDVTVLTGPYVQRHREYTEMSDYEIEEKRFSGFLDGWLSS
jgi:glycosyl transferase family 61